MIKIGIMALVKYGDKYIPIEEWEAIHKQIRMKEEFSKKAQENFGGKYQIKNEVTGEMEDASELLQMLKEVFNNAEKPKEDVQDTPRKNTRRRKS